MEKLKCKDCWYYQQISTGKQGAKFGRCKIRNSRTDQCGGRNQHNKACKKIKPIEPTSNVMFQMEINNARKSEYFAILESMMHCGIIKSIKGVCSETMDSDTAKIPVLIFKNDSVLFDTTFEKLNDLKGLEGEKISHMEVYLKSGE